MVKVITVENPTVNDGRPWNVRYRLHPVAAPVFPRRGRKLQRGRGANLWLCLIFSKKCTKIKRIGPTGEGRMSLRPLNPPMLWAQCFINCPWEFLIVKVLHSFPLCLVTIGLPTIMHKCIYGLCKIQVFTKCFERKAICPLMHTHDYNLNVVQR